MVENKDLFRISCSCNYNFNFTIFEVHFWAGRTPPPTHIRLAPALYLCELCALKCLVLIPVAQNKASKRHQARGTSHKEPKQEQSERSPSCHCSNVESFAQVSISISSFGFFFLFFDFVLLFPLLFLLN